MASERASFGFTFAKPLPHVAASGRVDTQTLAGFPRPETRPIMPDFHLPTSPATFPPFHARFADCAQTADPLETIVHTRALETFPRPNLSRPMSLIDISRFIHTGMPNWPGDTPTAFDQVASIADGYSANVGRLTMSVHTGSHTDAPYHYNSAGAKIDEVPLDTYVGPACVVDLRGHATLTTDVFPDRDFSAAPRLLFKTDSWPDATQFPPSWPLIDAVVPAWLAARGAKLIGLDFPSVDHCHSKDLRVHHACDAAGLIILENLDLRAVGPGDYDLIALPLKIWAGDGSPIRAVLRKR